MEIAAIPAQPASTPTRDARRAHPELARPAESAPSTTMTEPHRIDVSVQIRRDGVQLVTVVDVVSGQPICELPPPQVLHVLDQAIYRMRAEQDRDQ
jgi:hypothetical protein